LESSAQNASQYGANTSSQTFPPFVDGFMNDVTYMSCLITNYCALDKYMPFVLRLFVCFSFLVKSFSIVYFVVYAVATIVVNKSLSMTVCCMQPVQRFNQPPLQCADITDLLIAADAWLSRPCSQWDSALGC